MTDPRPRIWETVFLQFVGSQGADEAAKVADIAIEHWEKRFQMIFKYEGNSPSPSDGFAFPKDKWPTGSPWLTGSTV